MRLAMVARGGVGAGDEDVSAVLAGPRRAAAGG